MKTEKVFAIIFLIGLLFKIMHWPFAGPILVISLGSIGVLYFPLAFYFFSDKEFKRQNLFLSVVLGLFLSFVPVGILFKVLYWPGAQLYLLVGSVTAPVIAVLTYLSLSKATDELNTYYRNIFLRSAILAALAILFYATPTATLLKIQHRDNPELARLKTLSYENRDNEEYRKQLKDYLAKQDSLQEIRDSK
jgi:hypothetical protein